MDNVLLIAQYLKKFGIRHLNIKGYNIFLGGMVENLIFEKDGKTVTAEVFSAINKYTVTIYNYNNLGISGSCTCTSSWGGLCEHIVAVLYALQNHFRKDPVIIEYNPVPRISRNSSEPLLLEGFETFSKDFMRIFEAFSKKVSYYDIEMERINVLDDGLSFIIHEQYGRLYNYIVRLFLKDEKVYSFCTCNNHVINTCKHENFAISRFIKGGVKNLTFLKPGFLAGLHSKICQEFSIPENLVNEENIKVFLNNQMSIELQFTGKLNGLFSPFFNNQTTNSYDFFLNSVNKESDTIKRIFTATSEGLLPGFILSFLKGYGTFFSEMVTPITGKANKDNTRIVSRIERLTNDAILSIGLSENEKEVIRLSRELPEAHISAKITQNEKFAVESPVYFQKHRQMTRIFNLLDGHPRVYTSDYEFETFKKSNLSQVKVSAQPLQLTASVASDEYFINLVPKIKIGDETLDFDDKELVMRSPMIWEYRQCLYLVGEVTQIAAFMFFLSHPVIKSSVTKLTEFIQKVVLPFSARFNIDVEGLENIELNEIFLTPVKKQVYLSESKGFVLFAPAVAYNHKKEVLVLTGTSLVDYKDGQFTIFRRDQDFESDFIDFIRSLHPDFAGQTQEEALALPLNEIVDKHWFFDAFEAMKSKNVEVLGLQLLKSFKYSPYRASIRTGISSGVDWFDLSVNVSFGEYEVPLKKLRKHILQNEKFIELGDGSVGILPSEWVEKLKKYFRIGELQGDKLLLSKLRFSLVDELFDNIDETAIARELAEKKARIQSFEIITNIKKPAAIKAQLRDYQKAGLNWLGFLDEMKWGGILADDMGLGKTVQILTFLATQKSAKPKTSLVVLPTTLIFNWENEINKFYPTLKVLFYYGSGRDKDVLKSNDYQLVVTTYGVMINDIEILKEIKFNYVILDESQAIKNPLSKRYKAACLLQGRNRITLTGTPIENNTFDLYAQMNFVNPGMLGNQKFFKEQYSNPVDKDQDAGRANELRKLVSPFILRRTKEQVATELPPKTEDVIWCRMESDQFRIYEEYRNKYRMYLLNKIDENGLEKSKMFVLEGLLKLRQICNSPELLKDEEETLPDSVKLDELMRQINEKTGNHKIVVFSQFVQMLKIIERELKREGHEYEYFDGSSVQKQRRDSVNRFQEDEKCRVFLISLKAGGTGINLTSADYVYIFDPWWNPAVENQAIDRTYRIGQDKKVFAYRMICKDTVEEKILKYQERKKAVAADIIRTEESFIKHLTKEDIGELFG